jgi:hypothetical protein
MGYAARRSEPEAMRIPVRGTLEPGTKAYRWGDLTVFVSPPMGPRHGWHLSISHPDRYPTWDEIKAARFRFLPNDVTMAMLLPPKEEYVNLHPNCFQLWEIDAETQVAKEYRLEAEAADRGATG